MGNDQKKTAWAKLVRDDPGSVEVEYFHGARALVARLDPDGSLHLRRFGGPVYWMGAVRSSRTARLDAWLGEVPESLRLKLLEGLIELDRSGKADPLAFPLVPDEIPSRAVLRAPWLGEVSLHLGRRAVETVPVLSDAVRDLEHRMWELSETAPTGQVENPEWAQWPRGGER